MQSAIKIGLGLKSFFNKISSNTWNDFNRNIIDDRQWKEDDILRHQSIQENKIAFFKDKIRFSTTEALRNDNFNIEKYNPVTFTVNVDISIGNNENRRIG